MVFSFKLNPSYTKQVRVWCLLFENKRHYKSRRMYGGSSYTRSRICSKVFKISCWFFCLFYSLLILGTLEIEAHPRKAEVFLSTASDLQPNNSLIIQLLVLLSIYYMTY